MAYEILALVTNVAKSRFVDSLINGYAIKVTHFAVGDRGHLDTSPLSAKTPDPGLNPTPGITGDALPEDLVFGPKLLSGSSLRSDFCPVWRGVLDKGEGTGSVSSYYLLAKFVFPNPEFLNGVDGPLNPDETTHPLYGLYDKLWVFAYAFTPLKVKTDNESFELDLGVQF